MMTQEQRQAIDTGDEASWAAERFRRAVDRSDIPTAAKMLWPGAARLYALTEVEREIVANELEPRGLALRFNGPGNDDWEVTRVGC